MAEEQRSPDPKEAPEAGTESGIEAGAELEGEVIGQGAAEGPDQGGTDLGPELEHALAEAQAKAEENWNQCLRLQAELENTRKRAARDLENARKFALERLANELLPVKDSLEMGLSAASGEGATDPEKLREGTELTLKMLGDALAKHGIEEVDPGGQRFDPQYHEAMSMQPRGDVEPNTVVTVIQKGYLLNGRLLRPAMVVVSQAG